MWTLSWFLIFGVGAMSHFVFEWTDCASWAIVFFGTNESAWEHFKIMLWPIVYWWLGVLLIYGDDKWSQRVATSLVSSSVTLLVLHAIVSEGFKVEQLWLDIVIFGLAIGLGQYLAYHEPDFAEPHVSVLVYTIYIISLCTFTTLPPKIPFLFEDHRRGEYGPCACD